jgi:capsular exopolysaccharide synthesis family protein
MSKLNQISASQELTISGLLLILKRRRATILLTTLICFLLGVGACIFMTRRYEATGEIQVLKQSPAALGLSGMKSNEDDSADALQDNITLQTQANILRSSTLALKIVESLELQNTKDFQPKFNPIAWALGLISPRAPADPVNASLEDSPVRRTQVLQIFEDRLKIQPVGGTRLIEIRYLSSDPQTAARVVNLLMQGIVDFTYQTRNNALKQSSQWLGGQLDDLKKQAENLQARVVELQTGAGVYSLGATDASGKEMAYSATLDRLQQATQALSQATSNRILKGGIYQMVKTGDPESISGLAGVSLSGASQGVNNSFSLLQNLRAQEATARTQLAADTSKYGSANPKLDDERASVAMISAAIGQEIKRIRARAENDYRAAQITEANMQADYQGQRAAADKMNNKAIEYSIVKQEATESRDLYETLYQHLKEAGVIEGLHSSNVTVVDPGLVPSKPVRPNIPLFLAVSLLGGAILGAAGALFWDTIDDRVQSMDIIERSLNTPLMAVIPAATLPVSNPLVALPPSGDHWRIGRPLSLLLNGNGAQHPNALDTSNTPFSESLRSLRTALLLSRSSEPPRVILVTSAGVGEGKTTISLHLAASLVRNHSRVLLVEADMRAPGATRRLGLDNSRGLSTLLSATGDIPTVHPFADLPELAVLPAGPTPPFPSELLGSARMKDLVAAWSRQYDFILIDSPSILAVTDAAVLSKLADITLLITRHAYSTGKSLERAYNLLRTDPDTRVGVVLNGVDRGSSAYNEYFGYSGNHYYAAEKENARA